MPFEYPKSFNDALHLFEIPKSEWGQSSIEEKENRVKQEYKKFSLKYHPDRVPSEKKEEAQENFKCIAKACELLREKIDFEKSHKSNPSFQHHNQKKSSHPFREYKPSAFLKSFTSSKDTIIINDPMKNALYAWYFKGFNNPGISLRGKAGGSSIKFMLAKILGERLINQAELVFTEHNTYCGYKITCPTQTAKIIKDFLDTISDYEIDKIKTYGTKFSISPKQAEAIYLSNWNVRHLKLNGPDIVTFCLKGLLGRGNTAGIYTTYKSGDSHNGYDVWLSQDVVNDVTTRDKLDVVEKYLGNPVVNKMYADLYDAIVKVDQAPSRNSVSEYRDRMLGCIREDKTPEQCQMGKLLRLASISPGGFPVIKTLFSFLGDRSELSKRILLETSTNGKNAIKFACAVGVERNGETIQFLKSEMHALGILKPPSSQGIFGIGHDGNKDQDNESKYGDESNQQYSGNMYQ